MWPRRFFPSTEIQAATLNLHSHSCQSRIFLTACELASKAGYQRLIKPFSTFLSIRPILQQHLNTRSDLQQNFWVEFWASARASQLDLFNGRYLQSWEKHFIFWMKHRALRAKVATTPSVSRSSEKVYELNLRERGAGAASETRKEGTDPSVGNARSAKHSFPEGVNPTVRFLPWECLDVRLFQFFVNPNPVTCPVSQFAVL